MGPDIEQPLNSGDSFTLTYADSSTMTIKPLSNGEFIYAKTSDTELQSEKTYYTYNATTQIYEHFTGSKFVDGVTYYEKTENYVICPLSVFSNYYCQIAHHEFEPIVVKNTSNNKLISGNLKIKLADLSTPTEAESNISVMLNNYKTGNARYTRINLDQDINYSGDNKAFTLNINIPDNDFGLIMFYYIDENYSTSTAASLKTVGTGGKIERYNYGATAKTTHKLVPGIQVLKLNHNVTGLEVYADTAKKGTIIFGELSLVKGINENLKYQSVNEESTALTEMLKDIRDTVQTTKDGVVEDLFYYNMPIDNSRAINLNPLLEEDLVSADA